MPSSIEAVIAHSNLCTMKIGDIMTVPVQTVRESWSIRMVLDYFLTQQVTGAPVVDAAGNVRGVVSMSDILRFENMSSSEKKNLIAMSCYSEHLGYTFAEEDLQRLMQYADFNCSVSQIMTPHIISIESDCFVPEAAWLMREKKVHRVFVTHQQRLAGVVSTSNILDALLAACAWP